MRVKTQKKTPQPKMTDEFVITPKGVSRTPRKINDNVKHGGEGFWEQSDLICAEAVGLILALSLRPAVRVGGDVISPPVEAAVLPKSKTGAKRVKPPGD